MHSLSRRRFLERSLALGIGSSAVLTALNACGTTAPSSGNANPNASITLTTWDYYTAAGVPLLVQRFNDFTKLHPNVKFQRSYIPSIPFSQWWS